ncbi:right-handed parallel beta-helix repeat-containing protein [Klebsiella quasipneumoniae subsp. quasipneumoniae]|uniref:right-handed parallel beta-helix repeat-containing protein n=1 Tax=Klebsiella quasipneumoniae TaxID=1463165 RepID=UPI002FCD8421
MLNINRRSFIHKLMPCFLLFTSNSVLSKNIVRITEKKITPEEFGATGNGVTDDTTAIINCLQYAKNNAVFKIELRRQYLISKTIFIPDFIYFLGVEDDAGFLFKGKPKNQFNMIRIDSKNVKFENLKILFDAGVDGSVSDIAIIGIFFSPSSSGGVIINSIIDGGIGGRTGNSHCIRLMGRGHLVSSCKILNGGMCVTLRGEYINVQDNYITNHYLESGDKPWTPRSSYWDGITVEGASYCKITGNTVFSCGQSGIYIGGNGFSSHDILLEDNTVYDNWNKGIDLGVTGDVSRGNNVSRISVINNTVYDNRDPQIWLRQVSSSLVANNKVSITESYIKKYGKFQGEIVGVSLGHSAKSVLNTIENNVVNIHPVTGVGISTYSNNNIVRNNVVD